MFIEFIATSLDDVYKIEKSGADRVELISALIEGGLTPSLGLIVQAANSVKIPVNVMVRPHSRTFVYSDSDFEVMVSDVCAIAETNASAVVIGMLNEKGQINTKQLEIILPKLKNLNITFHRAIDESRDLVEAVKILSEYDEVKTVLTSGGYGDFETRMSTVLRMKESAPELEILVGSGITIENLEQIHRITGTGFYHVGTAIRESNDALSQIDVGKAWDFIKLARSL